jgi:hypothetical protein
VEELKDEIHKRDMQIIEERFKKGDKGNGWDAFTMMMESRGEERPPCASF